MKAAAHMQEASPLEHAGGDAAGVESPQARGVVSAVGRFHIKIADLMNLERELLMGLVREPDLLHPRQEALIRWALALGRMCLLRTPEGYDVEVDGVVAPFRGWLQERLRAAIRPDGKIDGGELRSLCPSIDHRMASARERLLDHFVMDFGAEHLDRELQHKELVLVLGGGGGCGYAHLGAFELVERLGVRPRLIVGASMGSLLGLFRAMEPHYDPELMATVIPDTFDLKKVFSPFSGTTRFGFPGAFHMQMLRVASEAMYRLRGTRRLPTFAELPIRLEAVVTGIRTGFVASRSLQRDIEEASRRSFSPFSLRLRTRLFFNAVRELSANPRMLKQLVFGRDQGTWDFSAVEAVGFSCSVPGLFSYDIFHDDPPTIDALDGIFERHRLWRLTDGGVINNVPSRVAWESVMMGNLGSRNAFIFAGDAFAPTPATTNLPFVAVQQVARPGVLSNRPFSDFHKTYKDPPSPLNLAPSLPRLRRIVSRSLEELSGDREYLRRALTPLPAWRSWST